MTYAEKLKNPKWQKVRLLIMQRDEFKCMECGDSERTLHVHHIKYIIGRDPWEYPEDNFKTLCETCHAKKHIKPEDKNFDVKQSLPEVVFTSISETVNDLTEWLKDSGSLSVSDQYRFIREYKCSTESSAPNSVVVVTALTEIARKINNELVGNQDHSKALEVTRRVRDIFKLRTLLVNEAGINPTYPSLLLKSYRITNG